MSASLSVSVPVCYHCKEEFLRNHSGKGYNRFSLMVKVFPGRIPLGAALGNLYNEPVPSSSKDFLCNTCFSIAKMAYGLMKKGQYKKVKAEIAKDNFFKRHSTELKQTSRNSEGTQIKTEPKQEYVETVLEKKALDSLILPTTKQENLKNDYQLQDTLEIGSCDKTDDKDCSNCKNSSHGIGHHSPISNNERDNVSINNKLLAFPEELNKLIKEEKYSKDVSNSISQDDSIGSSSLKIDRVYGADELNALSDTFDEINVPEGQEYNTNLNTSNLHEWGCEIPKELEIVNKKSDCTGTVTASATCASVLNHSFSDNNIPIANLVQTDGNMVLPNISQNSFYNSSSNILKLYTKGKSDNPEETFHMNMHVTNMILKRKQQHNDVSINNVSLVANTYQQLLVNSISNVSNLVDSITQVEKYAENNRQAIRKVCKNSVRLEQCEASLKSVIQSCNFCLHSMSSVVQAFAEAVPIKNETEKQLILTKRHASYSVQHSTVSSSGDCLYQESNPNKKRMAEQLDGNLSKSAVKYQKRHSIRKSNFKMKNSGSRKKVKSK